MSRDDNDAVPEPAEPVEVAHSPDGLDLARALTRSTASSTPVSRKRQRRRNDLPQQSPRRGRISASHPDDRDPQLLGGELSRLVDDRGWELDLRMRGVFARWPELVGAQIADHCTPESFVDGRLAVRTDSTAWATQLKLLAPQILATLNADLGSGTVSVIDISGPNLPNWRKGPRSVRDGRGPRDTYG